MKRLWSMCLVAAVAIGCGEPQGGGGEGTGPTPPGANGGKGDVIFEEAFDPGELVEGQPAYDDCVSQCTGGEDSCICDPATLCQVYQEPGTRGAVCLGAPAEGSALGVLRTSGLPTVVGEHIIYCDGAVPVQARQVADGCVINDQGHGALDMVPSSATFFVPDAGTNNSGDVFHHFVREGGQVQLEQRNVDGKTISEPIEQADVHVRFCSEAQLQDVCVSANDCAEGQACVDGACVLEGSAGARQPIVREYYVEWLSDFAALETLGEGGAPAFVSDHLRLLNGTADPGLFEGAGQGDGVIHAHAVQDGEETDLAVLVAQSRAATCESSCVDGSLSPTGRSACAEDMPVLTADLLDGPCPQGFDRRTLGAFDYCVSSNFCADARAGLANRPFCGVMPMGVVTLGEWKELGYEDPRWHPINLGELITANADRTVEGEFFSGDGEGYALGPDLALWCDGGQVAQSNPSNGLGGAYECTEARGGELGFCSFGREFSRQDGMTREGVATCGYAVGEVR